MIILSILLYFILLLFYFILFCFIVLDIGAKQDFFMQGS